MADQPYGPPMVQGDPELLLRLARQQHLADGLMAGLSPEQLAAFDEYIAGPAPEPDMTQETLPQQGLGEQFLGGFAGLENQPQGPARGFGQGLVQGLSRGLGSAGSRIQAQRLKLEAGIQERQAKREAANQQATAAHRARVGSGRQALALKSLEMAGKEPPKSATISREDVAAFSGLRAGDIGKQWTDPQIQARVGNQRPTEKETAGKTITREDVTAFPTLTGSDIGKSWSDPGVQKRVGGQRPSATAGKPPTEFQARASFFGTRADEASNLATKNGLENRVLKKAWSLQAPVALQSDPDVREYWRAMESFGLALNRLESGAAIAPTEFSRVRQLYFVAPGDKEKDIQDKALLRKTVIEGLVKMQGPGAQEAAPTAPAAQIPSTWKRVQ